MASAPTKIVFPSLQNKPKKIQQDLQLIYSSKVRKMAFLVKASFYFIPPPAQQNNLLQSGFCWYSEAACELVS